MRLQKQKIKIGIVGCGAIGSGIARSIVKDFKKNCLLTAFLTLIKKKAVNSLKNSRQTASLNRH